MRVTDAMIHTTMQRRIGTGHSKLLRLEEQVASGRRVVSPAEDPPAAALARRLDSQVAALDSLDTASVQARTRLESADGTLNSVYNELIRVQELAIQMSNETMSTADRVGAAERAESIRVSVVDLANTEVAGEHIFAGYASDAPPFLTDGTYVGDPRVPEIEISPGVRVTAGPDAAQALTVAGGTDVMDVARAVRDALAADDVTALRGCLSTIEQAQEQIRVARSRIGGQVNRVDAGDDVRSGLRLHLIGQKSEAIDADMPSTISAMTLTTRSLEAALSVAARAMSHTILDRIR